MNFLVMFLIANALFWGFATHSAHCKLLNFLPFKCPAHWIHLMMGAMFFKLAIFMHSKSYIMSLPMFAK